LGRPKFDGTIRTIVFLRLDVKKIILSVGEDPGSRIIRESIQFLDKLPIYKTSSSPILSMDIHLCELVQHQSGVYWLPKLLGQF
jgi:hypothetical protein